jgi:hypothetical protein
MGTYFGFVGDIFESFAEQLKSNLGLDDYFVVSDLEDVTLFSYREDEKQLSYITPAELLNGAINNK